MRSWSCSSTSLQPVRAREHVAEGARHDDSRKDRGPSTSRPPSNCAPRGSRSGSRPRYVYGSAFATSANAARPWPRSRAPGRSERASRRGVLTAVQAKRVTRPPAVGAPAARVHPADQLGVETDPGGEREAAPVRAPERDPPRPPGRVSRRAAATGSRGSPRARGSTLVPPPGTKPRTVSGRAPFNASLKPPSPEKTTTASRAPSRASSVACRPRGP